MTGFLIALYLLGCIIAFALLTGEECKRMRDDLIKFGCAPRYRTPLQSMYILFGLFGSWTTVLATILGNFQEGETLYFEISFKEVWDTYERGGGHEK